MDPYDYAVDLEVDSIDGTLIVGQVHTSAYGNGYGGLSDDDGIVTFEFDNGGRGVIIEFDTYDIDWHGEIYVYMNGEPVGLAMKTGEDGTGPGTGRAAVDASYLIDGTNVLQFLAIEGTNDIWGVSNILVTAEPALLFGEFIDEEFGHRFGNTIETDGRVSFQFFYQSTEDLTLYARGYDIDFYGEVEVFLNGISMGYMEAGVDNGLTGSSFEIAADDILANGNVVTFEAARSLEWAWGVTDLIMLNSGTNVSSMAIDPEFTDDGWVTWQEADKIYIGKYDPNSGALLEVLNESVSGALPFFETYYGSEFVETANGPVALGISEAGIIYLDEHDSYILEGTEGYRVGFLPKGDYDGLRFTMVPLDYWVYDGGIAEVFLYDNGEISLIDFGDPTTRAITWLNESEVAVFSETQMGIYNVDADQVTWITEDVYDEGYIAALETETGEKYISILHDDGFTDIWTETVNGWELWRRLILPDEIFGEYLFSPEFQQQDGKLYLMGISAELPTTTDLTAIVLYDLEEDTWSQVSDVQYGFDPEIVALENGGFSLYFRNSAEGITEWFNVTMEEVEALAVPGVVTPLPNALSLSQTAISVAPQSSTETAAVAPAVGAAVLARFAAAPADLIADPDVAENDDLDLVVSMLIESSNDVFEFEPLRDTERRGGVASAVLVADLSALTSGIGRPI